MLPVTVLDGLLKYDWKLLTESADVMIPLSTYE